MPQIVEVGEVMAVTAEAASGAAVDTGVEIAAATEAAAAEGTVAAVAATRWEEGGSPLGCLCHKSIVNLLLN